MDAVKSCATCYSAHTFHTDTPCKSCTNHNAWKPIPGLWDGGGQRPGNPELPAPALATQVGGDHYKGMAIQPLEYILANKLGFAEGAVVKYVSRWEKKGGVEDLKKARHILDVLIETRVQGA